MCWRTPCTNVRFPCSMYAQRWASDTRQTRNARKPLQTQLPLGPSSPTLAFQRLCWIHGAQNEKHLLVIQCGRLGRAPGCSKESTLLCTQEQRALRTSRAPCPATFLTSREEAHTVHSHGALQAQAVICTWPPFLSHGELSAGTVLIITCPSLIPTTATLSPQPDSGEVVEDEGVFPQ